MRKRSTYVALVGAVLTALLLIVGTAAMAQRSPARALQCRLTSSCAAESPAPKSTEQNAGGTTKTGASGGGSAPTAPKPPKQPAPPKSVPPQKGGSGGGSNPGSKPSGGGSKGRSGSGSSRRPSGRRSGGSSPRRSGRAPTRTPGGAPTPSAPGYMADNPDLRGTPNIAISNFRIPPFLLPIFQAAGMEYDVRWEYLAAICEIESNYGRNLNVSSAGALGWMQFMPPTWKAYGVDANKDGRKDPYNAVDSIFAAARYLKASGAPKNMRKALFAYNHAKWYVDSVIMRARLIAGLSPHVVGALTGLAEARFPVRGKVKYADDISEREARRRVKPGQNPARTISDDPKRKSIRIFGKDDAPAVAVNDGVVKRIGNNRKLGRHVVIEDTFGNQFTYAHLGSVSKHHPVPKEDVRRQMEAAAARLPKGLKAHDPPPTEPATGGRQTGSGTGLADAFGTTGPTPAQPGDETGGSRYRAPVVKERLFAHPNRAHAFKHGGADQIAAYQVDPLDEANTPSSLDAYFLKTRGFDRKDFRLVPLRKGSRVIGDTVLGRLSESGSADPHISFAVRPAGKKTPPVDPKPLLDGWKLLEATAIYRASGKNVLRGNTTVGQILMMSKEQLEKRVLADDRIDIYPAGRKDIERGQVSRQVLAAIAYLTETGFRPTITSLKAGHSHYTKSGNVSAHSSGDAVDISRFNNQPVLGNQQRGGLTYQAIKRLMMLQGPMQPHQLISLFKLGGPTIRMADHADHLHIGYRPAGGKGSVRSVLSRRDWYKLIDRIGDIDMPAVGKRPSKYAIPARGSNRGD